MSVNAQQTRSLGRWLRDTLLLWSNLRALGNQPIARATILIPLFGYLIIFNDSVLPYLQLSKHILHSGDTVPLSWRLLFVYFGLCFVAAASVTYQVFCPTEIKRSQTAIDYVAGSRQHLGDVALGTIESKLAADSASMNDFVVIRDYAIARSRRYDDKADRDSIYQQYWPDMLTMYFDMLNRSRRIAQAASLMFYTLGFILLGIPSADVFYKISIRTYELLSSVPHG